MLSGTRSAPRERRSAPCDGWPETSFRAYDDMLIDFHHLFVRRRRLLIDRRRVFAGPYRMKTREKNVFNFQIRAEIRARDPLKRHSTSMTHQKRKSFT